jgi:hypothetical protein
MVYWKGQNGESKKRELGKKRTTTKRLQVVDFIQTNWRCLSTVKKNNKARQPKQTIINYEKRRMG